MIPSYYQIMRATDDTTGAAHDEAFAVLHPYTTERDRYIAFAETHFGSYTEGDDSTDDEPVINVDIDGVTHAIISLPPARGSDNDLVTIPLDKL